MAQPGEQSTAAEDAKKKTKLGYHRQSIACVFCRRRKIRCTITDQDSGKCDTCFKLGKDCQFLKVNDAIALDHVTPIKRNKRALSLGHAKSQGQSWPHEHDDRAYESVCRPRSLKKHI
ncbi:hypothetical protein BCR37DRAFT_381469 [Protomyces lactucae-debilis]|uniref:Zn(2)-C6 fungal-type domain-containing protein n=1 Tax=Protomyces lactucae-debilis TaxID=2754530 RepID=A0A1Y2F8R4_PROLT|nr:uncharacterized protein BCR37DRAFT_381469 [Protomyces lactucae-debilis]ORY80017.1 hypothetical protein BCR37DRAFT_381469 [Protomyces lactucae-debilis]